MVRRIRGYFLAGMFSLLPTLVTAYVFWAAFKWLDSLTNNFVEFWFHFRIPGLGFLISVFLVTVVGMVATNVVGKHLISFGERILRRIPMVSTIYSSVKQLVEAFTIQQKNAFKKVVLVEYPRKGIYSIGFVSNRGGGELQEKTDEEVISVFIPTTPNPTSGFLLLVPENECLVLEMTVEEAFKVIISGGVLMPK